ncbi:MAG: hypothetical protein AABY09_04420, partial [Nanoarchaeota archaeon]
TVDVKIAAMESKLCALAKKFTNVHYNGLIIYNGNQVCFAGQKNQAASATSTKQQFLAPVAASARTGLLQGLRIRNVFTGGVTGVPLPWLDVEFTYGSLNLGNGVTADGFSLLPQETGKMDLAGISTERIYFVVSGANSGVYYQDGTVVRPFDMGTASAVDIDINERTFTLEPLVDLTEASITANSVASLNVDVTKPAYALLFQGDKDDVIDVDGAKGKSVFLLEDGKALFFSSASQQYSVYTLPKVMSFRKPLTSEDILSISQSQTEEAQQMAAEASAEDVEITSSLQTTEPCRDMDASSADPFSAASYAYTSDGLVLSDRCQYNMATGGEVLSEATCVGGQLSSVEHVCGTAGCAKGKCGSQAEAAFCVDTDQDVSLKDLELVELPDVFRSKGATAGFYASVQGGMEFGVWSDYCASQNTMIEYYCSGGNDNRARFANVLCKGGCIDGVCTKPSCFDSDGGNNERAAGSVKGVLSNDSTYLFADYCNGNALVEYYCDASASEGYNSASTPCANGCGGTPASCLPSDDLLGESCTSTSECGGYVCETGICKSCVGESKCLDAPYGVGYECNTNTGKCEQSAGYCDADADCTTGSMCNVQLHVCEQGAGTMGCETNADCGTGYVCNAQKTCVQAATCTSDTTCLIGQICAANTCTSGCRTDLNCGLGKQCKSNVCASEDNVDETNVNAAWAEIVKQLQRRLDRLAAFDLVLGQMESQK